MQTKEQRDRTGSIISIDSVEQNAASAASGPAEKVRLTVSSCPCCLKSRIFVLKDCSRQDDDLFMVATALAVFVISIHD